MQVKNQKTVVSYYNNLRMWVMAMHDYMVKAILNSTDNKEIPQLPVDHNKVP